MLKVLQFVTLTSIQKKRDRVGHKKILKKKKFNKFVERAEYRFKKHGILQTE